MNDLFEKFRKAEKNLLSGQKERRGPRKQLKGHHEEIIRWRTPKEMEGPIGKLVGMKQELVTSLHAINPDIIPIIDINGDVDTESSQSVLDYTEAVLCHQFAPVFRMMRDEVLVDISQEKSVTKIQFSSLFREFEYKNVFQEIKRILVNRKVLQGQSVKLIGKKVSLAEGKKPVYKVGLVIEQKIMKQKRQYSAREMQ